MKSTPFVESFVFTKFLLQKVREKISVIFTLCYSVTNCKQTAAVVIMKTVAIAQKAETFENALRHKEPIFQ